MANSTTKDHTESEHLDSDHEDEGLDELVEQLEKVEIDASKLTPLSPEVISKQVSLLDAVVNTFTEIRRRQ
jgi:translation initiation factor 2 subunit 3